LTEKIESVAVDGRGLSVFNMMYHNGMKSTEKKNIDTRGSPDYEIL